MSRPRVLFLYNEPDWAIHHVGLDWSEAVREEWDMHLVRFGEHESLVPEDYFRVIWGYSTLRYSGRGMLAAAMRAPLGALRWRALGPDRAVAVVQDPCEIFPEVPDWRSRIPRTGGLRRFGRLAVTSREMQEVLLSAGRTSARIPTRSRLPLRKPEALCLEPLSVFTRARDYPRKNLGLWRRIRGALGEHGVSCTEWLDASVRSLEDYIAVLDAHTVYVCTSWQEGGPLPVADALRRGCVVLAPRVGQVEDWITHGQNGFLCEIESDYIHAMQWLADNPARLLEMRREAVVRSARSVTDAIRSGMQEFLS